MGTLQRALTWSLGLWRLASGRIREDWRFLVGVWLLLACATTLLASGVVYGDAVAVGSLRSAIRAAPLAAQSVLVEIGLSPAQVRADDGPVRSALRAGLGGPGGEVVLELRSGSLLPIPAADASSGQLQLTYLESITGASEHATLVAGRWATPGHEPLEAAISRAGAKALGLAVGDTLSLADASDPDADIAHPVARVVIVGLYRPEAHDPYWAGDPLDVSGAATISGVAFRGPLLVDQADLLAADREGTLDARWRAVPDLDRLVADEIEPLHGRFDALPDQIRGLFPLGDSLTVTTDLGHVLDTVDRSLQVARGAVLILILQFAVVAAYAVLLISGMLADRRRPEVGLLRSRGASTAHVVALAFGEAVLLTVPALLVAPFAATWLGRLVGGFGELAATGALATVAIGPTLVLALGITGLLCVAALTLPSLGAGAEVAGIRAVLGRPVARTLAQRLGLDVALVVVAGLAIWQLRSYGAPLTRSVRGSLGLDPLLVAAPAVGLLAGAVLATRLVPRLGEIGERLLGRGRGLVSALGARQVARRPLRYTRAVLLLMLSAALGTFAAAYAASWTGSQDDQAAYQAGSDVRLVTAPSIDLPDWATGAALRAVPGVMAAMPVSSQFLSVGQVVHSGSLLALDARAAQRIVYQPPGSGSSGLPAGLAALAADRRSLPGLPLPPGTRQVRITFDAELTVPPLVFDQGNGQTFTQNPPADFAGLSLRADLRDADGRILAIYPSASASGRFSGDRQTMILALPNVTDLIPGPAPAEPLSLVGLEVSLANPFPFEANPITGQLTITSLAAAPADGSVWTALGGARDLAGWSWEYTSGSTFSSLASGPGLSLGPTTIQDIDPTAEDFRFRLPLTLPTTIPALAGDAFLAATGSQVGQTVTVRGVGASLPLHVVARSAEFPTLDPSVPFVIVDGPTLATMGYVEDGLYSSAADWWLSTAPAREAAVAATLSSPPYPSRAVISRQGVLGTLSADPVALGTLGALLLGSLAAAAFASIGFLVAASVSARERVPEFALLRALGLSSRQLTVWLAAEQGFLLLVGLLAGTAIGLVLAWLILPATLLSATGAPVVPAPSVIIPWPLVALVYAAALVLLGLTVLLVGRPVAGRRIAPELRAAGE